MPDTQKTDEDRLLAELYVDLKGAKKKRLDWMHIADKCQEAIELFGSADSAASKLGVSSSLLHSIVRLRKLDPRVQQMVRNRQIGFDSATRLNTIQPDERQYEVAKLLGGVSNKKQREIIQHAKQFPNSDLMDYRKRVLGDNVPTERIRVLIMPLPEELYQSLERASREEKKPVERILPEIVSKWLKERRTQERR